MRLVDCEERDRGLVEQVQAALRRQSLGGDVQQVEFTGEYSALDRAGRRGVQARVQELRAHAELRQCRHLVLHQRDQRRDDDRRAGTQQRGKLVAQRLAAAGRHQHQRVAAFDDVLDDFPLRAVERLVPEDAAEQVERCGTGVRQSVQRFAASGANSARATSYT